jgi:hypothetical protein
MAISRLGRIQAQPAAATPQPAIPTTSTRPTPAADRSKTDLITPAAAADLLSVNAKVLERWRSTGDGPAYAKLSSKTIRYRREDIDAFVAARVRASTAAA